MDEKVKAKIAAEMNLPITSFVTLLKSGESEKESSFEKSTKFGIRWFTPQCEDPICGHVNNIIYKFNKTVQNVYMQIQGTLAAAAIIFDKYGIQHY